MKTPEKFRVVSGKYATKKEDGDNGAFIIPAPVPKVKGHCLLIMVNSIMGWEHVALRHYNTSAMVPMKTKPSGVDIDMVRNTFWDDDETVIRIYPSKELYIEGSDLVVHLWRCRITDHHIPLPPALLAEAVGYTLGPEGERQKEIMKQFASKLSKVDEEPAR